MSNKNLDENSLYQSKIFSIEEIANKVESIKKQGETVVQCHGVFDLVHPGHIKHLQAAKREGDYLLVTLTADEFVNKGPGRPIFNENLRAENLAALEAVDFVGVSNFSTAVDIISLIKPNVYAKGGEYSDVNNDLSGKIADETQAVEIARGRVHFTSEETFSSSSLINRDIQLFPSSTESWLESFRGRYGANDIISNFEKIAERSVLVIGEAIIDEYVFCEALGKSAKDPILAFRHLSEETYSGGSIAVANHMAGFMKNVGLLTLLGHENSREEFIRQSLSKNVQPIFVEQDGVPTIHKKRFVDRHSGTKPFELYEMDDGALPLKTEKELLTYIDDLIDDYDMVVVVDYGHGMMTSDVIQKLCEKSKYLSVNTQANAGNRGFNTLTRYPRADYVSIAGNELELEIRKRGQSFSDSVLELADQIDCPRFTITLGRDGSLHYDKESGFSEVPALAVRVLDRVGAGDAVLSITAPLVAIGLPWDVIGFIANLAGAEIVGHLGNRNSLDRISLSKHIEALLK